MKLDVYRDLAAAVRGDSGRKGSAGGGAGSKGRAGEQHDQYETEKQNSDPAHKPPPFRQNTDDLFYHIHYKKAS
jgi:hypothetical protein